MGIPDNKHVDGFSVSSLFEAKVCHEFLTEGQEVYITSCKYQEQVIIINLNFYINVI